jgi:hypothetical protein
MISEIPESVPLLNVLRRVAEAAVATRQRAGAKGGTGAGNAGHAGGKNKRGKKTDLSERNS